MAFLRVWRGERWMTPICETLEQKIRVVVAYIAEQNARELQLPRYRGAARRLAMSRVVWAAG
jgi:hypothetical protein